MNILITSASRKVWLVRAFRKALHEDGGGRIIAVDTNPLSPALYEADEHALVPPTDDPAFVEFLLHLCRQREVRLLVPTRDEELPLFAQSKPRFEKDGTLVVVPGPEVVRVCQDKYEFIGFCTRHGFSVPRMYEQEELVSDMKFPLFVKPRKGSGGRQTAQIRSKQALNLALKEIPNAIIQDFVDAPEYTIDLFSDFRGRIISVVPRERTHVRWGESFVSRTSKDPHLITTPSSLGRALGLTGHNTIQCFLLKDEVSFIEVNPRFGGGAHLGFAAGVPTPQFLIKLARGEQLEPAIGEFRDNFYMLRFTEDLFLDASELAC